MAARTPPREHPAVRRVYRVTAAADALDHLEFEGAERVAIRAAGLL